MNSNNLHIPKARTRITHAEYTELRPRTCDANLLETTNALLPAPAAGRPRKDGWYQLRNLPLKKAIDIATKTDVLGWETTIRPTRPRNPETTTTAGRYTLRARPTNALVIDATYISTKPSRPWSGTGSRSGDTPSVYDAGW